MKVVLFMKNKVKMKTLFGIVMILSYTLVTLFVALRSIAHHSSVYRELTFPTFFFAVGVAIYFIPTEILLRFDRRTGFFLYKQARSKEEGLRIAGIFFTVFGLIFMLIPAALILAALLVECPPEICGM
jgi:hypothetical protein